MFAKLWTYLSHPRRWPTVLILLGFLVYFFLVFRFMGIIGHHPAPIVAHVPVRVWAIFFAFFILMPILLFILWVFFFAQFVLPVNGGIQRRKVFYLLLGYILGIRGRALSMRDGRLIESRERKVSEMTRGVMVLDSASAAVLRTVSNFTRAVGPGVVFLGIGERVDTTFDLRLHSGSLGPLPKEDPFSPQREDETPEEYNDRQQRRWSTSAKTRDGVEVVARITVLFHLDDRPDDLSEEEYQRGRFNTDLHGHTVSAWRAALHRPVNMDNRTAEDKQVEFLDWGWLPPHMAVDLWREYLQHFALEDLFLLKKRAGMEDEATALEVIARAIQERMTKPTYRPVTADGGFVEQERVSREYQVLQQRGIRIKRVIVQDVIFPPSVERELVERWSSEWMMRAQQEREAIEQRRRLVAKEGEEQAVRDFSVQVIKQACGQLSSEATPIQCATLLVDNTVKMIRDNPDLYAFEHDELEALERVLAFLKEGENG